MTITRNPLGNVFSTGFGKLTRRGWAGGGGVAWGAGDCPWTTDGNEKPNTSKAIGETDRIRNPRVFIFRALPLSVSSLLLRHWPAPTTQHDPHSSARSQPKCSFLPTQAGNRSPDDWHW